MAMQSGQPSSAWHIDEIEARNVATIKHFAICSVFDMIIPLRLCLEIVRVNPVIAPRNRLLCRFAIRGRTQNVDIPGTGTRHLQQLIPDRHVRRVQLQKLVFSPLIPNRRTNRLDHPFVSDLLNQQPPHF